jgi:hypothetical protein
MAVPERRSSSHKRKSRRWKRFRYSVNSWLDSSSMVGPALRRVWRLGSASYLTARRRVGTSAGIYLRAADVDKVSWVPPGRIVYCSLQAFNIREFKGRVIGGDWDRLEKKFDDLDIVGAFKQVCLEGQDWSETVFYQRNLEMIAEGHIRWGCKSQEEFDRKCRERELLFQTIRDEGYKSQPELASARQGGFGFREDDEVVISIGRHGDLLFSDGAHRLAIAKLLGVQEIPVAVAVRHPEWVALRQGLQRYAQEVSGLTHQPLTHPDLEDIPVFRTGKDRFRMINENMVSHGGRLLDIGLDLGCLSHRFEEEGFECYAVEDTPDRLRLLSGLRRAENRAFKTLGESWLDCAEVRSTHFNVTIALNSFHRFLDTPERYNKLVDFLGNLKTEELFFEPRHSGKLEMRGAHRDYTPGEFVEFLLAKSRLTSAQCIGTTIDGTPLYQLH